MQINSVDELVEYILSLDFEGTKEEIQLQQVLALDKYIKDNINYSFETIKDSLENPNVEEIEKSPYSSQGFFIKKRALCGGISQATNEVLTKLGIKSEYIYGHFDVELYGLNNWGHRWNKITIGDKNYLIDFTLNLCNYKAFICYDSEYSDVKYLLPIKEQLTEFDYIFNKELVDTLYFGGFKITNEGHQTDFNENGKIKGLEKDPIKYFKEPISFIEKNVLEYYYGKVLEKTKNNIKEK